MQGTWAYTLCPLGRTPRHSTGAGTVMVPAPVGEAFELIRSAQGHFFFLVFSGTTCRSTTDTTSSCRRTWAW